jgi:branched-chain amino acid transport system ATP-binding protein
MPETMLDVQDLHVNYGAIQALKGINFHLNKGEIVALIGANGAGKSTTLSTISGLLRPRQGRVNFQGEDISLMRQNKRCAGGSSRSLKGGVFSLP